MSPRFSNFPPNFESTELMMEYIPQHPYHLPVVRMNSSEASYLREVEKARVHKLGLIC